MKSNYFLITPVYKIWISIIDIIGPELGFLILNKKYMDGGVISNRAGVKFLFSKKENTLEIVFSLPNTTIYCVLRDSNKQIITNFSPAFEIIKLNSLEEVKTVIQKLKTVLENSDEI